MKSRLTMAALAALLFGSAAGVARAANVEVMHWRTSGGQDIMARLPADATIAA